MAKFKVHHFTPNLLAIALILLFIVPTEAFFRHLCFGELGNGRVDPIMSPGRPSQHLHVSFGASSFGFNPTIDDLLGSKCTSCSILQDHSVYWAPRMYFQHANGTFEMVPTSGGMTVYYFTEGPGNGVEVAAFPQNFRMIAGNSNKRAFYGPMPDPPIAEWLDSDRTQQSLMEKATGFNCLHYNTSPNEGAREHHGLRDKAFIDANCYNGIRGELMFPSCWNGKDLDSDNHTTHVAYPYEVQYGDCPEGFPVRLPVLFYETIYQTPLFKGIDGEFVFSNGDPTGFGYHGDFMCAWEDGVLQSAINNTACTSPASQGVQEACPVFKIQDSGSCTRCKMEVPAVLQEEPINLISELPGKVAVQSGPESATVPGHSSSSTTASPPHPPPGPTASMSQPYSNVATPATTSNSECQHTYTSHGMEVNLLLIEETVTVTIPDSATSLAGQHKRHLHQHGHRDVRARL
ncbi:uncharacterized protein Z518_00140 [Rhinocladiella mackenziei CBS 650.93]|uniref:DUF1996 domain-containing protein n=1 Tax=Rhinocladiella mackenziei CBS 650.93 TaxID=1442369 RepID=A0A0D2G3E1_9EURO|nr:uncharacterized protein Z518_00140 [Rhinocladiella mackenziei CBS 650.93]KIX09062.1 hypothetical protein Z518_00140 [Rhinocladiella mackenziei CBS 650.93]